MKLPLLGISLASFLLLNQVDARKSAKKGKRSQKEEKKEKTKKKSYPLLKPILKSQGFGKNRTIFRWQDYPYWSWFIQETDGDPDTTEYFRDEREIEFSLTSNTDFEIWLDWERGDILEQQWYIDRWDFHVFLQHTFLIYADTSFIKWELELPFHLFDASPFEFYLMFFPESDDMVCFGATQYLDLVHMEPVLRENDFDCTYSLIKRLTGDEVYINDLGWMYNMDCQGAGSRTDFEPEIFTGVQYDLTNAPFFRYEQDNETITDLTWFDIQLYEWYRNLFRYCWFQNKWYNLEE